MLHETDFGYHYNIYTVNIVNWLLKRMV